MRFFTVALSALAAFTSVVLAQTDSAENPIIFPTAGTVLVAGTKTTIVWTPTTGTQGTVTLVLRKGTDTNLAVIETITPNAPNSGSFDWTLDISLPAGKDYAIQIIWGTSTNYSPQFTIESTNTATSTSASSTSTTSSTSSTSTTGTNTTSSTTETTSAAGPTGAANKTTTAHSTANRPTSSSGPTDTGAPSLNSASQLSSSFALVFCILAGMAYLN